MAFGLFSWNRSLTISILQEDFFVEDDGSSLFSAVSSQYTIATTPSSSLSRDSSKLSLASVSTVSTAIPKYGVIDLSLRDVCRYIDDHKSLRTAEIVSTECYSDKGGAVTHRFLILELQREGRKDVWLRLDRQRGENVSVLRFLAVSGVTKANDRVRPDYTIGDP